MENYYTQEELDKLSNRAFNVGGIVYCIKNITFVEVDASWDFQHFYRVSGLILNYNYPRYSCKMQPGSEIKHSTITKFISGEWCNEVDFALSVNKCLDIIEKKLIDDIADLQSEIEECKNDRIEFDNEIAKVKIEAGEFGKEESIKVAAAKHLFSQLTDKERLNVMSDYCKYCGCNDPDCQCRNDD